MLSQNFEPFNLSSDSSINFPLEFKESLIRLDDIFDTDPQNQVAEKVEFQLMKKRSKFKEISNDELLSSKSIPNEFFPPQQNIDFDNRQELHTINANRGNQRYRNILSKLNQRRSEEHKLQANQIPTNVQEIHSQADNDPQASRNIRLSTVYTNPSIDSFKVFSNFSNETEPISPVYAFDLDRIQLTNGNQETNTNLYVDHQDTEPNIPVFKFEKFIQKYNQPVAIYCDKCCQNTQVQISFRLKSLGFWKTLGFVFQAFRCCSGHSLKQYQEVVYRCIKCKSVIS
ncbi:unnamed protein product [Blepharisma stoltei]|uniref:LITAF domain-containing protein n=1 Tax=Blepharisma stoltei TaxID=1481888 RepID=A0AAU9IIR5_9CILI|nr:unnamed protein product [Blepharisma stoltei]